MATQTIAALPAVLASLEATLGSLPSQLLPSVNLSALEAQLEALASDLAPILPSLDGLQQQTLFSNTTWLVNTLDELNAVAQAIPDGSLSELSQEGLLATVETAATRYTVMTVWSPDTFAVLFIFCIAVAVKLMLLYALKPSSVRRTQVAQGSSSFSAAKSLLEKPARSSTAHILNLILSTLCLGLQLTAYQLFAVPSIDYSFEDMRYVIMAVKILLVTYGCELLFAPVNWEIFLHHVMTFLLLILGQMTVYHVPTPKLFRLCDWLILQATLEQPTYAAMALYHSATYLRLQDAKEQGFKRRLRLATGLMKFMRWFTWPQKLVPAALAFYWLARMWDEMQYSVWGRTWCGVSTVLMSLLVLLQVKFNDDMAPLAAHMEAKLHGRVSTTRVGPVMGMLAKVARPRRRRARDQQCRTSRSNTLTSQDGEGEKATEDNVLQISKEEEQDDEGGATGVSQEELATIPAVALRD